jgi:peptidase M48-like protein
MQFASTPRLTTIALVPCLSLIVGSSALAAPHADAVRTVQDTIDALKTQLGLSVDVSAELVVANPLLVSVAPVSGTAAFVMSFQESFLENLDADELRTIIAHELGHVWIFTHHPYLQTERGANSVAMRVVSRENLERVYDKVFATRGVKADLAKFLPQRH